MKTKNKYKIYNYLMTYGWAILALIISIVVLIYFRNTASYQEEFTIYKNDCKNETNTFEDGDNFLCSDGSHGFLNNTNILYELNVSCYIIRGEKEVCNKFEVDKVSGWFENSCSGVCDCYNSMSCELTDRFILIFQNDTNKNLMLNWIENYTQEQVKYENNKLYFEKGSYDDAIKLSMINDICNLDTISMGKLKCKGDIDKSQLTRDWLSENCILVECYDSDWKSFDGINPVCVRPNKYKCFSDYEVEVK